MSDHNLPYGIHDLDPEMVRHPDDPDRIRCFVRGCGHFVRRPKRRDRGEVCPDHDIYCHTSGTYSYEDVRRNIIASPDLFAEHVIGHPFKFESHRLATENSEDALSWNVFRSLQEAGYLAQVAKLLVGEDFPEEPELYLWGIRVSDDSFEPWDLLIQAREQFESDLPVQRPLTEPDIALHLPGKYLVLIEAKFTSPNTCYTHGPRKDAQSLTLDELLEIYWDSDLQILDIQNAKQHERIYYQLWRNTVFAEWMAKVESFSTKAYHVNLVRRQHESESATEFGQLVTPQFRNRFRRHDWESIGALISANSQDRVGRLISYLDWKTTSLTKAFQ